MSRETLRLSGKQNKLYPSEADIKCIIYHTPHLAAKYKKGIYNRIYNITELKYRCYKVTDFAYNHVQGKITQTCLANEEGHFFLIQGKIYCI